MVCVFLNNLSFMTPTILPGICHLVGPGGGEFVRNPLP